eukprot:TRINITY_DN1370_c0_g2_i1.p1 TRINITY_DN1370_c0_g2~~TRINITY_DN1370_c0_g2_i1.p1  ORF type:complete len:88 (-),score=9.57 TRINITY_DN1370_c0_g2_i1:306-569(-)
MPWNVIKNACKIRKRYIGLVSFLNDMLFSTFHNFGVLFMLVQKQKRCVSKCFLTFVKYKSRAFQNTFLHEKRMSMNEVTALSKHRIS